MKLGDLARSGEIWRDRVLPICAGFLRVSGRSRLFLQRRRWPDVSDNSHAAKIGQKSGLKAPFAGRSGGPSSAAEAADRTARHCLDAPQAGGRGQIGASTPGGRMSQEICRNS
jgi:hypothetical protein